LTFPEKLCLLLESDHFRTIWWGHAGKSVVIDEEMFKVEVLGQEAPFSLFETRSMKTFIQQLNEYGFARMPRDHKRSAWLPEFLAEADAIAAHRKLLVYYSPCFHRGHPQLLELCRR
ncbi:HSFY1 protein, partial [Alectura lathami]|nr:HSFY1 protein [Alectura lathami]